MIKSNMKKLNYPQARRDDFIEKIHNLDVPDPYRWLENNESEETKKFTEEQQKLALSYLEDAPHRTEIKEKLTDLLNYPKYDSPFKRGDNYFMFKNSGLQNQHVMYKFKSLNDKHDEHEIFLDPNKFSEDGTSSLAKYSFSKDHKFVAYEVSESGSDLMNIFVRNVETKQDLPDKLERVKFSNISWTHDHLGFFYSRLETKGDVCKKINSDKDYKIYYHRINTAQSEDVLVFDMPDFPQLLIQAEVSDCGKLIFIKISKEYSNPKWYYAKLDENQPIEKRFKVYPIVDNFENEYSYLTNNGDQIYFRTNKDAPNYKISRLDINNVDPANWVDIVPEDERAVLSDATVVDEDKLAVIYMKDVVNNLEIRNLETGRLVKEFEIPIGTIASFSGKRTLSEIFFCVTSFLSPGIIYHYDFKKDLDDLKVFMEVTLKDFKASDFITKQIFFESKDGQVKVPIFITHGKDIKLDSTNPCLLYGYGGFSISLMPFFSCNRLLFMKYFKGVYAVCNIRGGGEYGTKWHNAGRMLNKQKSYDDFQQAAEYLIENGYTCKEKLIIEGRSNGGLLVGVCANQRPDLFGAAIIHVGVLDLLRFDLFTIGYFWTSEYGNHRKGDDANLHFENQLKLSPLHNVPKNCPKYPATLLLSSDHDNRVVPLHSFKHAAELQYTVGRRLDDPILLRFDSKAGHGAGKSLEKVIEESVDVFSFIQKALNLKFYN